jgi:hypothetical protein
MTTTATQELNNEQWAKIVDKAAHYYLDMSGEEFTRLYNEGHWDAEGAEQEGVMAVLALLPPR